MLISSVFVKSDTHLDMAWVEKIKVDLFSKCVVVIVYHSEFGRTKISKFQTFLRIPALEMLFHRIDRDKFDIEPRYDGWVATAK